MAYGAQFAVYALAGVAAGACIIVQQALVADLRASLASPLWAVFVSYFGGLATVALALTVMREPLPPGAGAASWPSWAGGMFGAFYILTAIVILPRLGATATFGVILAGQLLTSLVVDHYGLLGLARQPLNWSRMAGVALLGAGVLLILRR